MKQTKDYLIRFTYDFYCQGYEDETENVLVRAFSFEQACSKIALCGKYMGAREFVNMTIEEIP